MNKFLPATLLLFPYALLAQFYPIEQIPKELKQDAYAVVRSDNTSIQLNSPTEFKLTNEVVISVLEKSGDAYVDAHQYYDPNTKIESFEAEIFNEYGTSVRKFKMKDLSDASAVSGGQLYTDDRVKYLSYTPTFYPYTVKYKVVSTYKNTLFLPRWQPINYDNLAIESSTYNFTNNSTSTIRHIEYNLDQFGIVKTQTGNIYSYELSQLKPLQTEDVMIDWRKIAPKAIFASNQINIDGTQGNFDNWNDYGKWSYKNLVQSKLDFTPAQKLQFQNLVKDAKSEREKVELLYQYLQKKVRYIGVQLGIGGLSPFPNSYVETKSYGDCKALSNYMVGMLDAVGIKAYHTILYAGSTPMDIDENMMYQQGNHMIVYVPLKEEEIWLEATSQTNPFNYLGDFGGNRKVYIFDENGGKIIPSQQFNHHNNILTSTGIVTIDQEGKADIIVTESSKGVFYADNSYVKQMQPKNQDNYFKQKFTLFGQSTIEEIKYDEDWKNAEFKTNLKVNAPYFGKKQGNNLIFNLIPINNESSSLKKAKHRTYDFQIKKGYTDVMQFEINIPSTAKGKINIAPIQLTTEFGTYSLQIEEITPTKYLLKRTYQQFNGDYDKSKFNDYVEFRRQVSANDNIKSLLEF